MLIYNISPSVEAYSTNIGDSLDFDVILPQHQAHGTASAVVSSYADTAGTHGVDALITRTPGLRIGVKTADCVPVLLADTDGGTIAAIHSGWKGTLADIIGITIRRLTAEFGTNPASLSAVIGPCIHIEAFEVGCELYEQFRAAGYESYCARMPRFGTDTHVQWHIDLPGICHRQLMAAGLSPDAIYTSDVCTYSRHTEFYSARRLGSGFDRQRILNCIMLKNDLS